MGAFLFSDYHNSFFAIVVAIHLRIQARSHEPPEVSNCWCPHSNHSAPGHEPAGEIVALGPGADTALSVGDRVAVNLAIGEYTNVPAMVLGIVSWTAG